MKMFGLIQITALLVNKTCLSFPLLPSRPPSSLVLPSCGWLRSCGLLPGPPPHPQSQRTPPHRLSSYRGPGLKHTAHNVNKEGQFMNIPGLCVCLTKSVRLLLDTRLSGSSSSSSPLSGWGASSGIACIWTPGA